MTLWAISVRLVLSDEDGEGDEEIDDEDIDEGWEEDLDDENE